MKKSELVELSKKYDMEMIRDGNSKSCIGVYLRSDVNVPELDLVEDELRGWRGSAASSEVIEGDGFIEYRFYGPSEWFDENGFSKENRIRKARLESGLSQREFSRRSEIPLRTIQGWEGGQRTPSAWLERLILQEIERVSADDYTP